ncbi:hypothetical protein GFB57_18120 [Citrobacter sp. S39]|uniref:hypothetical protein n=1 Tax=Citrobacter TaxID=544 RepID=UPI0010C94911|nr:MULTISPECIES: hypothetical protein [Citrobacter]MDM3373332.1 hypothetical protein [Citrobacter sp. Cb010]MDM3460503.1 hypothetical protein [Citrobacter sp. Cb036]MDX7507791.1 hypothetical protein [Citrobacter freundii]QFX90401.1 hypothetical protein GFB57_18120 [Citrobacter sp. S39]TKV15355.1 hypothetical protein FDX04_08670 [Citrobacter sp. wls615]
MGLFDKGRKTPTLTQMAAGAVCYAVAPTVTLGVLGIATVIHYVRESHKETKEIEAAAESTVKHPVVKHPVVKSKYTLQMEEETKKLLRR